NFKYTFDACQHSCLQRLAWAHCKCVDPQYCDMLQSTLSRLYNSVLCLVNLTSKVGAANEEEAGKVCDCRPHCHESSIKKTVTYGVYPSAKYKVATGTQEQREILLDTQGGG
ncbi:hypothetical protein PMAYCL1PPCAC_09399, partial [Pristionchus mayeri]